MKLIDVDALCQLVKHVGLQRFNRLAIQELEQDFKRWGDFKMTPRHVTPCPDGVIELMPCSDATSYSVKYVNGHPKNTEAGKLSVVALGILADIRDGYPKLICEMTLLTALRSAAVAALGAKYLARSNASHIGMIGTGAQSEFLLNAMLSVRPIQRVSFYDIDSGAMSKFADNIQQLGLELLACSDCQQVVENADLLVTATASRQKAVLFRYGDLRPGTHIHAIGGDSMGKTELDPEILPHCKLVVEYLEQTRLEGEIQNFMVGSRCTEMWEIIAGNKPGRDNNQQITLLDAVGIALEDYSILNLVYRLADEGNGEDRVGREVDLLPALADPKDLFSLLRSP